MLCFADIDSIHKPLYSKHHRLMSMAFLFFFVCRKRSIASQYASDAFPDDTSQLRLRHRNRFGQLFRFCGREIPDLFCGHIVCCVPDALADAFPRRLAFLYRTDKAEEALLCFRFCGHCFIYMVCRLFFLAYIDKYYVAHYVILTQKFWPNQKSVLPLRRQIV